MDYKKVYEEWLNSPYFDEETKAELRGIARAMRMRSRSVSTWSWSLVPRVCAASSAQVSTG